MYPLVVQVEAQALVVTRLSGIRHIGVFIEVYGDAGTDRRTPMLWGNSVWRWWWRVSFRDQNVHTWTPAKEVQQGSHSYGEFTVARLLSTKKKDNSTEISQSMHYSILR